MTTKVVQLAVPTVSVLVPVTTKRIESFDQLNGRMTRQQYFNEQVYVVRFRTKHNGGIGVPGGRWKFQNPEESPLDLMVREGGEELGLEFRADQLMPFTVRARPHRDVRVGKGMKLGKYLHDPEEETIPRKLSGLPGDLFEPHHCIDIVYVALNVNVDPATLVPSDTEEVLRVELLDLTKPLPELPISDDRLLLETFRDWVEGKISHPPVLLHG